MYQKMPRATQRLPIYSLSLSVASILCSNISSSLNPSKLSLIAWNCLLLFQILMACQWGAPPWSAWSAERGARPCWRAPAYPAPLATGRLPALSPWGSGDVFSWLSIAIAPVTKIVRPTEAVSWARMEELRRGGTPGQKKLLTRIFWPQLHGLWPHLQDLLRMFWSHL